LVCYSVADPDPGSREDFVTPGSGMGKNPDLGSENRESGVNISDHISKSCVTIFGLKILILFEFRIRDGKFQIRDSRINIQDPQHWFQGFLFALEKPLKLLLGFEP
jgi:hypothetical protein